MKQHSSANRRLYNLFVLLTVTCSVFSCKKTETVPFERTSKNTILEYAVTNSAEIFYGAIDNINNTITLYIPYYIGIDQIVPEIKIDAEAKLLNAAGDSINLDGGLEAVPVDTTGYTYTVMGSDNVKRRYTLRIEIAPHPDQLKVGYMLKTGTVQVNYDTAVTRAVSGRQALYGNFGSTSANAKFTFTNRVTQKTYTDILKVVEVVPGANYYTMIVDISPDADSGYYDVQVKHQGRTAQLQPIHLNYRKPKFENIRSASAYAAGDTVTFTAISRNLADSENGSIIGLERVYMKFVKSGFTYGGKYPATFPADLFGKELEMKIVSATRSEVKVIFPEVPEGAIGSYVYAITFDFPGIGFYFDFKTETGWGKNNMLSNIGSLFTINPKK